MARQMTKEHEMRLGLDKPNNSLIYGASLLSIGLSLFTLRKDPPLANFIGLWAPTILGLGILLKENQILERSRHMPAY